MEGGGDGVWGVWGVWGCGGIPARQALRCEPLHARQVEANRLPAPCWPPVPRWQAGRQCRQAGKQGGDGEAPRPWQAGRSSPLPVGACMSAAAGLYPPCAGIMPGGVICWNMPDCCCIPAGIANAVGRNMGGGGGPMPAPAPPRGIAAPPHCSSVLPLLPPEAPLEVWCREDAAPAGAAPEAAAATAACCLLCASAASMDSASASPSSAATQVQRARQSGVQG